MLREKGADPGVPCCRKDARHPSTAARAGGLMLAALAGGASFGAALAGLHGLAPTLGIGPPMMALVLASALGGTALGGGGCARLAARSPRPLRWCAAIMILAGALAAVSPELLGALPGTLGVLARLGIPVAVARPLLAVAVVVPSAILLGATWPLWVRGLVGPDASPRAVATTATSVHAVQLLGAALGAYLADLVLAPTLGFVLTLRVLAAAEAMVGLTLLLAFRRVRGVVELPAPSGSESLLRRGLGSAGLAVAGCAAIGCQILWSRSIAFFFDGLHGAAVMILVADLLALGLGAAVVLALVPRVRDPGAGLVVALGLAALATLAALVALPAIGGPAYDAARAGAAWRGETLLIAGALLAVPAATLGALLPLASWSAVGTGGGVGAALGRALVALALGGALAALTVPLVLVPTLGLRTSWATMAVLHGLGAVLFARSAPGRIGGLVATALAIAAVVWTTAAPRPLILDSQVFARGRGLDRELLSARDGRSSSVSVVRDLRRGSTALYTDTFAGAGGGRDNPGMRLLGHLPVLLHQDPARVLVTSFGTGTVVGAVASHPEVRRLRVVDPESAVFAAAGHFAATNHDVLHGRAGLELEVVVAEGRADLLTSRECWDVITLEPPMPYTPRGAWLYSEEFYRIARERLNTGGILCQWVPVHALSLEAWRTLPRSFVDVFPEGALYFFEQCALLVGRRGGGYLSWESLAWRARRPEIAADLERALVSGPEDLLAGLVASGPTLRQALADVSPLRDDRPMVIFLETRPESRGFQALRDTLGYLRQLATAEEEQHSGGEGVDIWCRVPEQPAVTIAALRGLRRDLLAAREVETGLWCDARAGRRMPGGPDPVIGALSAALADHPDHLEGRRLLQRRHYLIARALARSALLAGRPFEALSSLAPFAGLAEWELGGEVLQGVSLLAAGDGGGATAMLDRVLERHPREVRALVARAAARALTLGGPQAPDDRAVARDVDPERAAAEIAFIEQAQRAARDRGFLPLADLRQRLETRLEAGIWDEPAAVAAIPGELGLEPGDPRLLLLARPYVIELEGEGTPRAVALRAAAALGIQRAVPHILRRDAAWRAASPDARRALAALVPRDAVALRGIFASEDAVARRLLAAGAANRGSRDIAPLLLPGLDDPDAEVRLFTDRALRRLTGLNAGYDYLADESRRRAAAARWRELLGR